MLFCCWNCNNTRAQGSCYRLWHIYSSFLINLLITQSSVIFWVIQWLLWSRFHLDCSHQPGNTPKLSLLAFSGQPDGPRGSESTTNHHFSSGASSCPRMDVLLLTSSALCRFQLLASAATAFHLYLVTKIGVSVFKLGEGFQCFKPAE